MDKIMSLEVNMDLVFSFPYISDGVMNRLEVPVISGYLPAMPISQAVGTGWGRTRCWFKEVGLDIVLLKVPGIRGNTVCLRIEDIDHWLKHIKVNYLKDPSIGRHFQDNFVSAFHHWSEQTTSFDRYEVLDPDDERAPKRVEGYDVFYTEEEAQQKMAETLGADAVRRALGGDKKEKFLLMLNQMGVVDYETLHTVRSLGFGIPFFRLVLRNGELCQQYTYISFCNFEHFSARSLRRGRWFPAPIWYLMYPELYERQYTQGITVTRDGKIVTHDIPHERAVWHTAEFQQRVWIRAGQYREDKRQELDRVLREMSENRGTPKLAELQNKFDKLLSQPLARGFVLDNIANEEELHSGLKDIPYGYAWNEVPPCIGTVPVEKLLWG